MSGRSRVHCAGLWRKPDFLKLWAGQAVSEYGSLITSFALPWMAVAVLKATPAQVALLSAAGVAPKLLLSLLAGVWVDRLKRRRLMLLADGGRVIIIGSVPVMAWLRVLGMGQLYLVTLAASALTVVFEVAYAAYLPSLLSRDELVEGNSKIAASNAVAEVTGLGLAGVLVQALSAPGAVLVDALTFVVSVVSLLWIRGREPEPEARASVPGDATGRAMGMRAFAVWRELREGLGVTFGHPEPRALVGSAGVFTLFGNMLSVVLLLYLVNEKHLPAAVIGAVFGIGGISAFVGALFSARVARRWGIGRAITWGLGVYTGAAMLMPLAGGPVWLVVALLAVAQFSDAAHTVYDTNRASLLQATTPGAAQGRLHATLRFVEGGATLAGLALGGILGQVIGAHATLFVAAFGLLLAPLWLARSPVAALRALPSEDNEGLSARVVVEYDMSV
ncbi:MAG: hypothetical protein OJF49_002743 [Ktedonobacterales bacterium]|nr:MAG: hypothetical protein OJF49_002743 [Ktedonobacterales bacterium]